MIDLTNSIRRRGFLGGLAASAALGMTGLIEAAANTNNQSGESDAAFDAWIKSIKGKHKQVFDAPSTNGGFPFAWPRVFQLTNNQVGVPNDQLTAVVILRHDAIPLAMVDALWTKYNFGEVFHAHDPMTKTPWTSNPFWKPKSALPIPGMALNELLDSGVLVGVCDMALKFYSQGVAEKMKLDAAEIKKDWVGGIFPGIQIVPSGVLAINRAQEAGCTYCYAGEG